MPKAGVSADLDALAAYVASLERVRRQPVPQPAPAALSTLATEGKAVFTTLNCASCHGGAASRTVPTNNPANIGTIKATSGQRLGAAAHRHRRADAARRLGHRAVPARRLGGDAGGGRARAQHRHDGDADLQRLVAYLREIGSEETSAPCHVDGGGLLGSYFNGIALAGTPVLTRTEAVNFDWGTGRPGSTRPGQLLGALDRQRDHSDHAAATASAPCRTTACGCG